MSNDCVKIYLLKYSSYINLQNISGYNLLKVNNKEIMNSFKK